MRAPVAVRGCLSLMSLTLELRAGMPSQLLKLSLDSASQIAGIGEFCSLEVLEKSLISAYRKMIFLCYPAVHNGLAEATPLGSLEGGLRLQVFRRLSRCHLQTRP